MQQPNRHQRPGQVHLATRMPEGVIGLDIDHYGDKQGWTLLADLVGGEDVLRNALKDAPRTTRRTDGPSGIYLLRYDGPKLEDPIRGHVEILQRHHRYALVAPSTVDNQPYEWVLPNGGQGIPNVDDLPTLTLDLTAIATGQQEQEGSAGADGWTEGEPIPAGQRDNVVAQIAWEQAKTQPTKAALIDYMLTVVFPHIEQPVGDRFSKEATRLKATVAWDKRRANRRAAEDAEQAAEQAKADATNVAATRDHIRENLLTAPDEHGRLWAYNPATGSYLHENAEQAATRTAAALHENHDRDPNVRIIKDAIVLLKADADQIRFDNPHTVAVANGTLNLEDPYAPKLEPHSPKHLLPTYIPTHYDKDADTAPILKFLWEVLPAQEHFKLLAQYLGATLTDRTAPKGAPFVVGPPNSGKTVLFNQIIGLLGVWNVASVAPQHLNKDHLPATLRGKKANIVSDLPTTAMKDPSLWKQLTGEDPILMNPKFKEPAVGYITAASIYATNSIPDSWDDSGAVHIRRHVINTAGAIPPEDRNPRLTAELRVHAPALLTIAVLGYQHLQETGWVYHQSEADRAAQHESWLADNHSARWATERITGGGCLTTRQAVDDYLDWMVRERLLDHPGFDEAGDRREHRVNQTERKRLLKNIDAALAPVPRSRHGQTGMGWTGRQLIEWKP